jgi:iduronate 2-sulfatase
VKPLRLVGGLIAVALLSLLPAMVAADGVPARRPNVLFIISDDLRTELGCYGVTGIKTPNIDALAARSVRFDRACVQYPLCNPERSSLLTGHYPTQTGVMDNRQWWGYRHPEYISLPRWFKDHGYATITEGKIFHIGIDDTDAWTEGGRPRRYAPDASEHIDAAASGKKAVDARDIDPDEQTPAPTARAGSDRIVVLPGDGETYQDYQHATRAIELLKKYAKGDQPFFLACGFTNPHAPPRAPKKFYDLYDVNQIPLPVDYAPHPTVPAGFPALSVVPRNTDLFVGRDASEAEAREMKRAYWAATSFMDAQVGRVLAALDELGLRDDTIVVFWGDHGYHLSEKGRWSKAYSLFEVALRAPFLIAAPGVTPPHGAVCVRPIETLNLYRTLCDLCGLPVPDTIEGTTLRPLLLDSNLPWDRPAYSVVAYRDVLGRSVRTARWRYSQWVEAEQGEVLFDEVRDPNELTNLATDPRYADTVAELKAMLKNLPGRTR